MFGVGLCVCALGLLVSGEELIAQTGVPWGWRRRRTQTVSPNAALFAEGTGGEPTSARPSAASSLTFSRENEALLRGIPGAPAIVS